MTGGTQQDLSSGFKGSVWIKGVSGLGEAQSTENTVKSS